MADKISFYSEQSIFDAVAIVLSRAGNTAYAIHAALVISFLKEEKDRREQERTLVKEVARELVGSCYDSLSTNAQAEWDTAAKKLISKIQDQPKTDWNW